MILSKNRFPLFGIMRPAKAKKPARGRSLFRNCGNRLEAIFDTADGGRRRQVDGSAILNLSPIGCVEITRAE